MAAMRYSATMVHILLKPLDETDYLASELHATERHEFVNGSVYAMAGASARHNRIAVNLASHCNLRGTNGCQTFASDMKLRLDAGNLYYYPDVMLVCDAQDTDPYFKTRPCMVAEVLSPHTEGTDRREKLLAYQKLPSLCEYLLLAQDRIHIELYQRVNMRYWSLTTLGAGDTLTLACAGLTLPVADLYRGVDWDTLPAQAA
jgi:Uma2 family endonuclease